MPTTLNIPVLSSAAGINSDGVIFGSVAESNTDFLASKRIDATTVNAYRRDVTAGGFNFYTLSTPASNATNDDVQPFGGDSDMGSTDTFYVSDTDQAVGLYVNVTTAGVWSGTGLKIYDSADGITAGRELTGVVDPSDGFRVSGWSKITWTVPSGVSQAFSPVPGDLPSKKYIMIKLNGFVSVTTAPILGRLVVSLISDGQKYLDVTSLANGSLSSMSALPDYFPTVGQETIAHFTDPTYGFERYVFIARTAGIETIIWEYLRNDGVWTTLSGVYDPSSNATVTPGSSPEKFPVRWAIPADWTAMPNSILMSDDTTHTATAYWLRVRVTAVSALGFITAAAQRIRTRKFGASSTTGIVAPTARTFTYMNIIDIGGLSGNTTVAQITNMTTGSAASFTIPASPTLPINLDITDISFSAGDKYALQHVSGAGNITGIQMIID